MEAFDLQHIVLVMNTDTLLLAEFYVQPQYPEFD